MTIENIFKDNYLNKLSELSCSIYIITLYIFSDHPQLIVISDASFLIFLFFGILNMLEKGTIQRGAYIWLPLIFVIYSTSSIYWAMNDSYVIPKVKTLLQLLLFLFLFYNTFIKNKKVDYILKTLLIAGLCLSLYSIFFYGFDTIINAMLGRDRLGSGISQENTFGMQLATTVVLCFYYWIFHKKNYMILLSVVPFLLAMSSGSRKAIIIIIIGMIALLYVKNGFKKIYKFIFSMILFLIIFNFIIRLPIFNTVYLRWESMINLFIGEGPVDNSADYRRLLINEGLVWFKEKPIFGYGLANYRGVNLLINSREVYAHNNFLEVLVGTGLIGFSLFYSIYVYIFIKLLPYLKTKNSEVSIVLILLIIRLVMDYGSVSYDSKITWLYFGLGFLTVAKSRITTNNKQRWEQNEANNFNVT